MLFCKIQFQLRMISNEEIKLPLEYIAHVLFSSKILKEWWWGALKHLQTCLPPSICLIFLKQNSHYDSVSINYSVSLLELFQNKRLPLFALHDQSECGWICSKLEKLSFNVRRVKFRTVHNCRTCSSSHKLSLTQITQSNGSISQKMG